MAEQEEEEIMWPGGFPEAKSVDDFDFIMSGKNGGPITKIPKSRLAEVVGVVGESMPAIQGGATAATATVLPAGPVGQNRWFDASWGYWKYNNVVLKNPTGTDGIPEGNDGQLYWNGTAVPPLWSISKMQALPKAKDGVDGKTFVPFNAANPNGYVTGSQLIFEGGMYETIVDAAMGQSPITNPEKFDFIPIKDESKVAKNNTNDKQLYNGVTIPGFYISGSNIPIAHPNSETTDWIPVEELTEYIATGVGDPTKGDVLWGDVNKNVIIRGTGLTTTGATSPKYTRFAKFTVTYQNATILGKQGQYVVFSKKLKPLNFYKQNPSNINIDYNPISGNVDINKFPFNQFAIKRRTNLFNYKTVNKGMYVDSVGNILTQAATGTNNTFGNGRMSAWMPAKPVTYYTRSGGIGTQARGIAFFDSSFNLLQIDFISATVTVLSPANTAWVLVNVQEYTNTVTDEANYRYFQFQEGQIATPFKEYDDLDIEISKAIEVYNPAKPSGYYSGNQIVFEDVIYQVKTGLVASMGQSPRTNPEKFDVILKGKTIELYDPLKVEGYITGSQIVFDNSIYQVKSGQTATTGQSPLTNPEKFTELVDSVTIEKFNPAKPTGYLAGAQIIFNGILYQVKTGQTATTGQSPATNPEKFDELLKDTTIIVDDIKDADPNAVNSIAVNRKLNAISYKITDDISNFTLVDGMAYKNNSDALVSDSNYAYYFKQVKEGDIFDIEGHTDPNVSQAILFKSDVFTSANRIEYLGFRPSHAANDLLKNRITVSQDGWLLVQKRKFPVVFSLKSVTIDRYVPILQNNGLAPNKYISANGSLALSLQRNSDADWQDVTNSSTLLRDNYFKETGGTTFGQTYLNSYTLPVKKGDKVKFVGFAYMANTSESTPFPVIINTDRLDLNSTLLASNTEALASRDESKIKTYLVTAVKDGFIKVNVRYYHTGSLPFNIYKKVLNPKKVYATSEDIVNVGNVKFPFNNAPVINEWSKEYFAHNANIYKYNKGLVGDMFNIYFCNETGMYESLGGEIFVKLSIINAKDFTKNKYYPVLKTGDVVGSFKQRTTGGIGVYDPFLFQNDAGDILCGFICDNENDTKGTRFGGRYFDFATKTFANAIIPMTILYKGTIREFTTNNFVDIAQEETGLTGINRKYAIITGYFPKYSDGYYYTCTGIITDQAADGYQGSIIRTLDGIAWEYFATLPGNRRAGWELAPEIIGNYLYISVRDVGVGTSTTTTICRYNLATGLFDREIVLPYGVSTRTVLIYRNSKLYLIRNVTPNYVNQEGVTVGRSRIEISVLNQDTLEQIITQEILTEYGGHYHTFCRKDGNIFLAFTEDRSMFNPASPKGNICIVKLDDYLKI